MEYSSVLLDILREEKKSSRKGGIYHKIQVDMTYNSNHIEGSRLTHDQTRYIYETNTLGFENESVNVDDIVETVNHFRCIDIVIDNAEEKLSENFISYELIPKFRCNFSISFSLYAKRRLSV